MQTTIEKSAGMGAVLCDGVTTFRVWAPHANKVYVTGDFNEWQEDDLALEAEENGYWAGVSADPQEGQEYKYLIHNGDQKLFRNDPYAFEMTNSNGNSIIRTLDFNWEDDDFEIADWNKLVIYELHVGTFNRKDPDRVGTFEDVIEKLPYLQKLGINGIELLPVAEFAGGISWGYNPAHPFAVETDYGGPDGFAKLVKEAHRHGIAVIMDVVYNHFGPSDVDLWQFDGWSENDKGGIYFYNDHRSSTPWGDTRPDYGRPEVRQYLRDNALMWIEKYHCDGLRMDATSYIRYEGGGLGADIAIDEGNQMMREINLELQTKYPKILTIAEDLKGDEFVTNGIAYGGIGYGAQWDMHFVHPVREVLQNTSDDGRDLQKIVDALEYTYSGNVFKRVIYTESHDEVANGKARVPEEIQPGDAESEFAKRRAILGMVLTLTAPGIPMLFQGQEFIEDEYFQDTEALDWDKYKKHQGIVQLLGDLIRLRTGALEGANGLNGQHLQIVHYNTETKVLAFKRGSTEEEQVLVILNFRNQDYTDYGIGIAANKNWKLRINADWKGYDEALSDLEVRDLVEEERETDGKPFTGVFNIPSYGALIYTVSATEG
ncbi:MULTISPECIES: alpha-amylase family glycosyl hydrolase [unclassified Leeuwenhoekiella]|uniref:alpha-amylase family glycosyl hydrolase n=1 Tax=unclassified Leeuwenhoekiella TaxID=2615029 RepID=UPI000C55E691|nr:MULTISPECIES: alpha-amylase family glycosyl hydrolase [unclassified Leeuwenhoekiella]MBA80293.1 1,4-alpha-glucan branching protein [Leeuwenhoekiella sp.]|tara:strand:- start:8991 stop:10793 length:1803 start_codon:yes stop_codon:yes gene_type:complete